MCIQPQIRKVCPAGRVGCEAYRQKLVRHYSVEPFWSLAQGENFVAPELGIQADDRAVQIQMLGNIDGVCRKGNEGRDEEAD